METKLSSRDSTALYFVRVVAILSSVAAHVSVIDLSTPLSAFATRAWDQFSCVSVGAFLICAGILYTRAPGDSRPFWRRKWGSMVVPWLFCGCLTYGYRCLAGVPGSLPELARWLLGHGSWLYYVTIHLIMLALFKPLWDKPAALWTCLGITVAQLTLKARGGGLPSPLGNDYLNPLHWMGFFALGVLLRRRGLRFSRWEKGVWALVCMVSTLVVFRRWIYDYFHIWNFLFSVSAFFVLLELGRRLADTRLANPIRWAGSCTYCVYLLHMLIVPPILRRIPLENLKYLLSPIIGLALMLTLIALGQWITKKLPFGKILRNLVGVR